jgi:hypothetical protein
MLTIDPNRLFINVKSAGFDIAFRHPQGLDDINQLIIRLSLTISHNQFAR